MTNIQSKMVENFQPLPPLAAEVDWEMKTSRVTQSVFISLSLNEMSLEVDKLQPTNSFLSDLKIARSLQFKRLKYEYFNMLVRKYGFLYWQEPSVETGSFLEIEVDLVYQGQVDFKEALRTLKTMWKKHLWRFLKDFKVYSERRISEETLEDLLENLEIDGEGYRFFRRFKGLNGEKPFSGDFEKVKTKMKMPKSEILVKSSTRYWDYNNSQFIFNFPGKASGKELNDSYLTSTILNGEKEKPE